MTKIFNDKILEQMEGFRNFCVNGQKNHKEVLSLRKDIFEQYVLMSLHTTDILLEAAFVNIHGTMSLINGLSEMIEKLPRTSEYDELKGEMEKIRTKALKTLAPIQKKLKEAEEREKRAEEMNGYG